MKNPENSGYQHLLSLRYWLRYELSTSALSIFIWLSPILILIMSVLSVIFTPYMLRILFKEKRYGWITLFFIIVCVPLILLYIVPFDKAYFSTFSLIPLACFYLYCFILKITIEDWISEKRAYMERIYNAKPLEKFEDLWSKR